MLSSFMTFWTGLHKAYFQEQIVEGVKTLLSTAWHILAAQRRPPPPPPAPLRFLPMTEDDYVQEEEEGPR